jgi:hypothetical protein
MNVKQLKRFLDQIPDSAQVVVPGFDHTYVETHARFETALVSPETGILIEDFGEEITPWKKHGRRVEVVIIGGN